MPWDPPEISVDEDAITGQILDNLQDKLDGWTPVEGALDVALGEEVGRVGAGINTLAIDSIEYAVAGIGSSVYQVPYELASTASISVDMVVTSTGVVVPAGFMVTGTNPVGDDVDFQLLEAVTTTGTTQAVTMHAATAGAAGNDVPEGDLPILTATATVISATATSPSSGGADDEALVTYLDRLVDRLSVLRLGGVLADDMAALARSVPGVARATGVDLHNAMSGEDDVEKTVTVFVIDDAGEPVSPEVKADVYDLLEGAREPNFVIFVEDPTYTQLEVVYSVIADSGADHDTVAAAIESAVLDYLNPARWGATDDNPDAWQDKPTVRLFDIAVTIGAVTGVASVVSVTLNGDDIDVTLAGKVGLPASAGDDDPTTVTGTVS